MSTLYAVLSVICALLCILTVVLILLQKKRSAGLSGAVSGMGQGQTYWDKNKSRSLEGQLERWTKIFGACFMILCLALNVIK